MNRRRAKKAAVKWYAEQGLARDTGARLTGRERVWLKAHRRALMLFTPFGDVERAMEGAGPQSLLLSTQEALAAVGIRAEVVLVEKPEGDKDYDSE